MFLALCALVVQISKRNTNQSSYEGGDSGMKNVSKEELTKIHYYLLYEKNSKNYCSHKRDGK